jgi:hypothetical protein
MSGRVVVRYTNSSRTSEIASLQHVRTRMLYIACETAETQGFKKSCFETVFLKEVKKEKVMRKKFMKVWIQHLIRH